MQEFDMIRDNDRVLVCLSTTGKDSLSLLHTLHQYRFYARSKGIDFEIGAATIDAGGSDPMELMSYLKILDVPYFYEEQVTDPTSVNADNPLDASVASGTCSFCDKSVRTQLYPLAKRKGYNVLALGQHLDDLTESFLISVFHGGVLKTMKAHYYIRREDLRVVRPFIYVREKALKQFTENKKLAVSREQTPHLSEVSFIMNTIIVISRKNILSRLCQNFYSFFADQQDCNKAATPCFIYLKLFKKIV